MISGVALLLGRPELRPWLADALDRMERRTDAGVKLVVRTDRAEPPADPRAYPFDAETVYTAAETVEGGPRVRLPDTVVDRVARETDVAVQNGVGILTGHILTAPDHGVLSYHHGDVREYRGVVTHFWNYLNRDETAGVTLLQLTEELDAGRIAAEATLEVGDAVTWSELERRKQRAGVPLLAEAVANLSDPDFEPTVVPESELGEMYRSSDVTYPVIAKYLLYETAKAAYVRYRKLRYLLGLRS
jgi:folate-dependent phosphoribosylglycinamide formyltransferase PurN